MKKKIGIEDGEENSYPKKHSEIFDTFPGSGLTIVAETRNVDSTKLERCFSKFYRQHPINFDIKPDGDKIICEIRVEGSRSFGELKRRLLQLKGTKKIECNFLRIRRWCD